MRFEAIKKSTVRGIVSDSHCLKYSTDRFAIVSQATRLVNDGLKMKQIGWKRLLYDCKIGLRLLQDFKMMTLR